MAAVVALRWPKWTGDTLEDPLLEEVHQGEEQGPLQWKENRDLIRLTVRQEVGGTWCACLTRPVSTYIVRAAELTLVFFQVKLLSNLHCQLSNQEVCPK